MISRPLHSPTPAVPFDRDATGGAIDDYSASRAALPPDRPLTRAEKQAIEKAWGQYCKRDWSHAESIRDNPVIEAIFRNGFQAGSQVTANRFMAALRGRKA